MAGLRFLSCPDCLGVTGMGSKTIIQMAKAVAARLDKSALPKSKRTPPTDEQMRQGNFASAGMAYRRTPMIDTLFDAGKISESEHRRLTHYRDQEAVAEQSLTKSCLDVRVRGGIGNMPISALVLSAQLEVGRIERDLGSLRGITRSIAIDDWSLSQWCCARYGSREKYDKHGRFVAIVPINERSNMRTALLELRFAAGRIVA